MTLLHIFKSKGAAPCSMHSVQQGEVVRRIDNHNEKRIGMDG